MNVKGAPTEADAPFNASDDQARLSSQSIQ